MMHGHEKSDPAMVVRKPVNKAARSATEPSVKEPVCGGVGGAKGGDQRECGLAKHAPDTV
jgi:hypothetical protein